MPCNLTAVLWHGSYTRGGETQRIAEYNNPIAARNCTSTELVPEHGWAHVWEADLQMKLCFLSLSQILC